MNSGAVVSPTPAGASDRSPPPSGSRFDDVARVGTVACSASGYERVRDCYNVYNPPAPSIEREISTAWRHFPATTGVAEFPTGSADAPSANGDYAILPFTKSTSDGRISFAQNVEENDRWFRLNRPENLDADSVQVDAPLTVNGMRFHPLMMFDPMRSNHSNLMASQSFTLAELPQYNGADLCETTSTATVLPEGRTRNPYACRSLDQSGTETTGDCYDVTLIGSGPLSANNAFGFEFRSVNLTLFVNHPHSGASDQLRVYPRTVARAAIEQNQALPAYEPYAYNAIAPVASGGSARNWPSEVTAPHNAALSIRRSRCYLRQADGSITRNNQGTGQGPLWCAYFDDQRYAETFTVETLNDNGNANSGIRALEWNGRHCAGDESNLLGRETASGAGECGGRRMDVPTVTKDGRLIVMRLQGNFYAFNESDAPEDACQADQFRLWRPISAMPSDDRINERYGVAMTRVNAAGDHVPFRQTNGEDLPFYHEDFTDYSWIDREGRNLFFSANNRARHTYAATAIRSPEGVRTRQDENYQLNAHLSNPSLSPTVHPIPTSLNPSHGSATFVSVLGSWTRGKVVVLDNALNATDWSGRVGSGLVADLEFPLYRDQTLWIAPGGSRHILSMENQWYALNARRPAMPFDVVWQVANDTQHNAEVVFDEYMNDQAMAVVHMNAPIGSGEWSSPDDGFTIEGSNNNDIEQRFAFRRSPRLQNAATGDLISPVASVANDISLLGGARVEPVGLGGVVGRGAYLDGVNDHIEMTVPADPQKRALYLGLWLDLRRPMRQRPGAAMREVVYTFANGSTVSLETTTTSTGPSRVLLFEDNSAPSTWAWCASGSVNNAPVTCASQSIEGSPQCLSGDATFPSMQACFSAMSDDSRCYQSSLGSQTTFCGSFDGPISGTPVCQLGTSRVSSCSAPAPAYQIERRVNLGRSLVNGTFFHLGLVLDFRTAFPRVEVLVNGTSLGTVNSAFVPFSQNVMTGSGPSRNFWIGNPGSVSTSSGTVDLRTAWGVEGWMDEFRMYWLRPTDVGANHFREMACNLALGTLVNVSTSPGQPVSSGVMRLINIRNQLATASQDICEQISLASHNLPTDLAPQLGETVCVGNVHRNPESADASRCRRQTYLALTPLTASAPRPNFVTNPFCLSCHNDSQSVIGLQLGALTSRPEDVVHDPRRQPLNVPAVLSGTWPEVWPDAPIVVPADGVGRALDPVILGHGFQ